MLFSAYPYHNFSDYNLDYIIYKIKKLTEELNTFISVNAIKYSDPINWDITRQYESNTVVVNPYDGTAYISTQPVPSGVNISNTDYWTPIFNYGESLNTLREQIADANEEQSTTATKNYSEGDLIWINGLLFEALTDIAEGNAFIIDSNIGKITIEERINNLYSEVDERIINDKWYVTPEEYGAIGDGNTDDTEAVEKAINNSLGYPVYLKGSYLVTQTINIERKTFILGTGKIIRNGLYDVLYFSNCNVKIKGIEFQGENPGTVNPGTNYITFDNCVVKIENCRFININCNSVIKINNCINSYVKNCYIYNFAFVGILVYNACEKIQIINNIIEKCTNLTQGYGIQNNVGEDGGNYARDLLIDGNIIKNIPCWDGIMSHGGRNVTITNNICDECRTGIDCSGKYVDQYSVQQNYVIANNILLGSSDASITATNPNIGIVFGYNAYSGEYINSDTCTIANNEIKNFIIGSGSSTCCAIRLANANNVKVIGNNCMNVSRAIICESSIAPCRRWTISDNTFSVRVRGFDFNGGVYTDVIITNNTFKGLVANLQAFTIANNSCLIRCFEKQNTFDQISERALSSGARWRFHTEYEIAPNANQGFSAYKAGDIVLSIQPSVTGFIGWVVTVGGINTTTPWAALTQYNLGNVITNGSGAAYVVTRGGISGTVAPSHTDGEANNGECSMLYLGADTVTIKTFGAVSA